MTFLIKRVIRRLTTACLTIPTIRDWLGAGVGLLLLALIYLPIGFKLGFLHVHVQTDEWTIVGVIAGTLLMPGMLEELVFRGLLIPHPLELMALRYRWFWISFSWALFMVYHLNPSAPLFFRSTAFLLGAGLLGVACTVSYLQSGSLWVPVMIHWLVAVIWLLLLGGLEKFH